MSVVDKETIQSRESQIKEMRKESQKEVNKWKTLFHLSTVLFNSKNRGRDGKYTYTSDGQSFSLVVSEGKVYTEKEFKKEETAQRDFEYNQSFCDGE